MPRADPPNFQSNPHTSYFGCNFCGPREMEGQGAVEGARTRTRNKETYASLAKEDWMPNYPKVGTNVYLFEPEEVYSIRVAT